jgi:hypothetical protein
MYEMFYLSNRSSWEFEKVPKHYHYQTVIETSRLTRACKKTALDSRSWEALVEREKGASGRVLTEHTYVELSVIIDRL